MSLMIPLKDEARHVILVHVLKKLATVPDIKYHRLIDLVCYIFQVIFENYFHFDIKKNS